MNIWQKIKSQFFYFQLIYGPKIWHCKYDGILTIHDYFNIMICNFPILTFRRFDYYFVEKPFSLYTFALLGFDIINKVKNLDKP